MTNAFFELEEVSHDDQKKKFLDHMNFLRSLSNEEYTLYKKWVEVKEYRDVLHRSQMVKANIWQPTDLNDEKLTIQELSNLKPAIKVVEEDGIFHSSRWILLRVFTSSFEFEQNPGRFIRLFIIDENTNKYLGCSSIASDVMTITCRDNWIGWDQNLKTEVGRLNNSAIGTTIVGTQPFGYNFLGGKLIASAITDPYVRNVWKSLYNDELVGITTTSLYGVHSMYQRIPFWKELGETAGKVSLKPDDEYYQYWHNYIKQNYPEKYSKLMHTDSSGPATGVKQKILTLIMKEVGVKTSAFEHGFNRGVFYAPLYANTKEYLNNKTDTLVEFPEKQQRTIKNAMEWWLPKAISRYQKLKSENRLNPQVLFYNDIIDMSWDEVKSHYLGNVGR